MKHEVKKQIKRLRTEGYGYGRIEFFHFTEEEIALMYDLAAKENSKIPRDLDDIMMYSEAGDMARYALRMTKKGVINDDDWKQFIRYIKTREAKDDD